MKKERLLTILVIALIVLNGVILSYLFLERGHHHPGMERGPGGPPRVDKIIIETLHFNNEQVEKFDVLKRAHHASMVKLDEDYEQTLRQYFGLLIRNPGVTSKDSLESRLCQIQKAKANVTYEHFKDLQGICNPEQKAEFHKLIPALTEIIAPPRHRRPPPDGNGPEGR